MEEELNYSTVVFKNGGQPPKEKNKDSTIYSTVKAKGAATTAPNGEPAAHSQHFCLLAVCLAIVCVLLVASISAIIYMSVVMNKQEANFNNVKTENQQLIREKSTLENKTEELRRDREDLNWTLNVILKFKTFPVNEFCPEKKCQPCREGWIRFQEKCYLFYERGAPWKEWEQSQSFCLNNNADLVVIDSLQEQEFVVNHTKFYYDEHHGYWIGLRQIENSKDWLWVGGRNDTLGYWGEEQLADAGPCALMIPKKNPTASWDPANCKMLNKFICESDILTRSK
ncbi:C-type lectin domain family 9 member A isoform X2 [Trachinotus anak]|uniref:C-type lectin domain family 9 member A isoform X2 n=1 Tax=Trachinotus anak TaxID=443729 RepID=UPI0039F1C6B5